MQFLRVTSNPWGQEAINGVSWDLLWWFAGAAVAFIIAHAACMTLARVFRRRAPGAEEQGLAP